MRRLLLTDHKFSCVFVEPENKLFSFYFIATVEENIRSITMNDLLPTSNNGEHHEELISQHSYSTSLLKPRFQKLKGATGFILVVAIISLCLNIYLAFTYSVLARERDQLADELFHSRTAHSNLTVQTAEFQRQTSSIQENYKSQLGKCKAQVKHCTYEMNACVVERNNAERQSTENERLLQNAVAENEGLKNSTEHYKSELQELKAKFMKFVEDLKGFQ